MASKKRELEGIALLSMYNDEEEEDEEMEDVTREDEHNNREVVVEEDLQNFDNRFTTDSVQITTMTTTTTASFLFQTQNSIPMEDSILPPKEDRDSTPPSQPQNSSFLPSEPTRMLPPLFPPPPVERQKRSLGIVDYAHDETAMSPEAEEGEITGTGHVTFGEDLQNSDGNFQGTTPPGTVQILTPSIQGTPPQSSEQPELLQSDNSSSMNRVAMEFETTVVEETVMISVDVDPLDTFLPPPPRTLCSEELQEKINKFLKLKSAGKSFNAEVRNRKDYRNPDFLLHAVRYQDIDQIGSCFSKDVFDPHGYDKSDFYDELEADMKSEMEKKEQERKKSQKLEFVVGGTQAGGVTAAHRNVIQNPAVPTATSTGFHSYPTPADSFSRDSRQNKKSKWDKVDSDRNNPPLAGGSDALSTAAAHAVLLSAGNVGAGYTAFAQQKRREAEQRRSSEKRRS